MNEMMLFGKTIPEYYPTMHMDGYTQQEILRAVHKKMLQQVHERDLIEEVRIRSEVKLK